eukprot:501280-Prorocentrum_minimum.AAC.1
MSPPDQRNASTLPNPRKECPRPCNSGGGEFAEAGVNSQKQGANSQGRGYKVGKGLRASRRKSDRRTGMRPPIRSRHVRRASQR